MRRTAVITAVAAGLLAIPAAASAHPALNPSELPPGETVESRLVVPHGCAPGGGMPETGEDDGEGGEAEPTVELAVQKTDDVTMEPMDVEGWDIADDGEAWVWSDAGGATTDVIEFPVMLSIDAGVAPGEAIYLRAYQECADGSSFQWIGTPDEEATYPAIKLAASEGEVGTAEPDEGANTDHGEMDMDQDGETAEDAMTDDQAEETATEDMADGEMATEEATAEDTDAEADEDMAMEGEEAASDGGLSTPLIVLLVLVALGAVAALVVRTRTN